VQTSPANQSIKTKSLSIRFTWDQLHVLAELCQPYTKVRQIIAVCARGFPINYKKLCRLIRVRG
jgi:hypothetical protein